MSYMYLSPHVSGHGQMNDDAVCVKDEAILDRQFIPVAEVWEEDCWQVLFAFRPGGLDGVHEAEQRFICLYGCVYLGQSVSGEESVLEVVHEEFVI